MNGYKRLVLARAITPAYVGIELGFRLRKGYRVVRRFFFNARYRKWVKAKNRNMYYRWNVQSSGSMQWPLPRIGAAHELS